jgi:murein DD-endopeptidase MepM/ murein hydrolase activator NlpD
MMRGRLAALLTTVAILGGCTAVDDMSGQQKPYQAGYMIAPMPGETLDGVAARFNVPASALIQANHLQPPYTLAAHQTLVIPPPASYTVRQGDSLQGIATNLGVDPIVLAHANGMERPYSLHIGQSLKVPGGYGGAPGYIGGTEPTDVSIASRGSISAAPLAAPNAAAAPGRPGAAPQPLPPAAARTATTAPAYVPPPPSRAAASPMTSQTALAPPPSTAAPAPTAPPQHNPPPPAPVPAATPAPAQQTALAAPPAVAGGEHFIRPVGGSVIEGFGAASGGQTNDGINIGAPAGTPVKASDSGTVIYTGNELSAFGNLVLIRHAGGWVTAYGHLAKIDVQKGSTVVQGQPIGTVGQTGSAPTPQLHFEIRQGSKPVDPAPFLDGKG